LARSLRKQTAASTGVHEIAQSPAAGQQKMAFAWKAAKPQRLKGAGTLARRTVRPRCVQNRALWMDVAGLRAKRHACSAVKRPNQNFIVAIVVLAAALQKVR